MDRACFYSRWVLFVLSLALASVGALSPTATASAQEGEARLLFERGNQHLAAGMRARGRRRQRELEQALDAYVGVLRLGGRTRNVVFNLALTVQELGRDREAFNYYSEYLSSFDLGDDERAEGQRRLEAIRPRVAVLEITSEPAGAEIRIDRRDLPVRGATPIVLAVDPGEHTLFLTREGFQEGTTRATATVGQSGAVNLALVARPVSVQFIAPGGGTLTLDGEPIEAGHAIDVAPGTHTVQLALAGAPPIVRTFEVQPGADPMVLELSGAAGAQTRIHLAISNEAEVLLDGVRAGEGTAVELPTQPGDHTVQIRAEGFNTITRRFSVAADQRLDLSVTLGATADESGLDAARTVFAVLASASVLTAAPLAIVSLIQSLDYQDAREEYIGGGAGSEATLNDQADELETMTIATDIALGITAAFGISTIVLLAVGAGDGTPSSIEVGAVPTAQGGAATLRGRF